MNYNSLGLGEFAPVITLSALLVTGLFHVLCTVCVWNDAGRLREQGRGTVILTPFIWGMATIMGGLLAVALYWLFHHSPLSSKSGSHSIAEG